MASYLNAPTSGPGGLVMQGDASGVLQLQAAGNTVATLSSSGPNAGIQVASYAAPAFSAYGNAAQTINTATYTKVTLNTKEFDTANCFDNVTNYRFTPTVAGYYQFTGAFYWNAALGGEIILTLYKNGVFAKSLYDVQATSTTAQPYQIAGTALIYANGTTDYFELYTYQSSGSSKSSNNTGGASNCYFSAFLARSA